MESNSALIENDASAGRTTAIRVKLYDKELSLFDLTNPEAPKVKFPEVLDGPETIVAAIWLKRFTPESLSFAALIEIARKTKLILEELNNNGIWYPTLSSIAEELLTAMTKYDVFAFVPAKKGSLSIADHANGLAEAFGKPVARNQSSALESSSTSTRSLVGVISGLVQRFGSATGRVMVRVADGPVKTPVKLTKPADPIQSPVKAPKPDIVDLASDDEVMEIDAPSPAPVGVALPVVQPATAVPFVEANLDEDAHDSDFVDSDPESDYISSDEDGEQSSDDEAAPDVPSATPNVPSAAAVIAAVSPSTASLSATSSPVYEPSSPAYDPSSPVNKPSSRANEPSSPAHEPSSPAFGFCSPSYVPSSVPYVPTPPMESAQAPAPEKLTELSLGPSAVSDSVASTSASTSLSLSASASAAGPGAYKVYAREVMKRTMDWFGRPLITPLPVGVWELKFMYLQRMDDADLPPYEAHKLSEVEFIDTVLRRMHSIDDAKLKPYWKVKVGPWYFTAHRAPVSVEDFEDEDTIETLRGIIPKGFDFSKAVYEIGSLHQYVDEYGHDRAVLTQAFTRLAKPRKRVEKTVTKKASSMEEPSVVDAPAAEIQAIAEPKPQPTREKRKRMSELERLTAIPAGFTREFSGIPERKAQKIN